jgi:hypothetical protein
MNLIPHVDFCGLNVSRLVLGANPFGGFSHQNQERDKEMVTYYTVDRILDTWRRAEMVGINTMITNNETPHVVQAVKNYRAENGALQWIAQVSTWSKANMYAAIDEVVDIGCKALYIHGGIVDEAYRNQYDKTLRSWCEYARSKGVPVGVAGHAPEVHLWVDSMNIVDFHCVCFFNCGSLHTGKGENFSLSDIVLATECIRRIQKPCIGYKIMGAGRIEARMAFEYAFERIKPGDVVNVGMHRGDKDDMVEQNAATVDAILRI